MLFHAAPCWFIVSLGFRAQGRQLSGSSTEEALSRGAERRAGDFVYPQQVSSDHVPPGLLPCSSHHICLFIHPSSKTELTEASAQPLAEAWHDLVLQVKLREVQLCTVVVEPTFQS